MSGPGAVYLAGAHLQALASDKAALRGGGRDGRDQLPRSPSEGAVSRVGAFRVLSASSTFVNHDDAALPTEAHYEITREGCAKGRVRGPSISNESRTPRTYRDLPPGVTVLPRVSHAFLKLTMWLPVRVR